MLPLFERCCWAPATQGPQIGTRMGNGPGDYDPAGETAIHGVVETVLQNNASLCRCGAAEVALGTDKGTLTPDYVRVIAVPHFGHAIRLHRHGQEWAQAALAAV